MRKNILIIEDEKSIQNILKAFLEDAGYSITLADDGIAGMAAFHKATRSEERRVGKECM